MTYIPDCRTDETYNQKYLNENDKEFIRGLDYTVSAFEVFLDNLDTYTNGDIFDDPYDEKKENEAKIFILKLINSDFQKKVLKRIFNDWMEMDRNEFITSMIDHYSEEEYEEIRKKVDNEEDKHGL